MKHIIKLSFCLTMLLLFTAQGFSQRGGGNRKAKMKNMKITHLTNSLEMSQESWQKFWPIYNDYSAAKESIETEYKMKIKSNQTDNPDQSLNLIIEKEQEVLNLKKDFVGNLSRATSANIVLELFEAEKSFKQKLLKQYKNKRKRGGI